MILRPLALAALLTLSGTALAQVRVEVGLPSIRFEVAPPLVLVSPGLQVVEDCDDEVYFHSGFYWVRQHDHWYRTRHHGGGWERMERAHVPAMLFSQPGGRYVRYKPAKFAKGHGDRGGPVEHARGNKGPKGKGGSGKRGGKGR
jgi:hypothetical protein